MFLSIKKKIYLPSLISVLTGVAALSIGLENMDFNNISSTYVGDLNFGKPVKGFSLQFPYL